MDRKIRKYCISLRISAMATIAIDIWNLIKNYMSLIIPSESLDEINELLTETGVPMSALMALIFFVLLIWLFLDIYVATRAFREASGKKTRVFYLIVAAFMAIGTCVMMIINIIGSLDDKNPHVVQMAANTLLDLTTIYAFLDLIYSGICLRRARRLKKAEV